jgi:dTDP-4-amino-4,6-dideoxygalactose transaminase
MAMVNPQYMLVSKAQVSKAHSAGLKVVPWTANSADVWDKLIDAGVDAIITDDPAALIEHLKAQGILAVFHYIPLNLSPMGRKLGGTDGACPVAEDVSERLLRLPFYTNLSVDEQNDVIAAVQQFAV